MTRRRNSARLVGRAAATGIPSVAAGVIVVYIKICFCQQKLGGTFERITPGRQKQRCFGRKASFCATDVDASLPETPSLSAFPTLASLGV